jgi:hypothetical protein
MVAPLGDTITLQMTLSFCYLATLLALVSTEITAAAAREINRARGISQL